MIILFQVQIQAFEHGGFREDGMLLCAKEEKNDSMLEIKEAKKKKIYGYMTAWNGRNVEKQNVDR